MNVKQRYLIKKTASLKNTLLLGLLLVILHFFIIPEATQQIRQHAPAAGLLDDRLFYLPDQAFDLIGNYYPKGKELYIAVELSADLFYWLIIAGFLSAVSIWSAGKVKKKWLPDRQMILIPLLMLAANVLENGAIVWMLAVYPETYPALAVSASIFTLSKWVLLAICLALAGWYLLLLGGRKFNVPQKLPEERSVTDSP